MLIMLFNFFIINVMVCLIILRSSRVGRPRVAIRSVVIVWRRWSFLTNLAAQCCTFSRCLIWVVVCGFLPYMRGIFKFWLD